MEIAYNTGKVLGIMALLTFMAGIICTVLAIKNGEYREEEV